MNTTIPQYWTGKYKGSELQQRKSLQYREKVSLHIKIPIIFIIETERKAETKSCEYVDGFW